MARGIRNARSTECRGYFACWATRAVDDLLFALVVLRFACFRLVAVVLGLAVLTAAAAASAGGSPFAEAAAFSVASTSSSGDTCSDSISAPCSRDSRLGPVTHKYQERRTTWPRGGQSTRPGCPKIADASDGHLLAAGRRAPICDEYRPLPERPV